jgi:hypothetical protein
VLLPPLSSTLRRAADTHFPCIGYVTSDNATSGHIRPVIYEVVEIVSELVTDLQMSSLSVGDCPEYDIIKLTAIMFKVFVDSPMLLAFSRALILLFYRSSSNPLALRTDYALTSEPT